MSNDEKFLARWSRRKVEEADKKDLEEAPDALEQNSAVVSQDQKRQEFANIGKDEEKESLFDLTKLPPINSIVASTDIRPFLAPGVPPELTRAALRRAWVTDPAIRDFVGISENSWDFTKPDSMAGFGPLLMTDSLRKIVNEMFAQIGQTEQEAANEAEEKRKVAQKSEARGDAREPIEHSMAKDDSVSGVIGEEPSEKINNLSVGNFSGQQDTTEQDIATQHDGDGEKANDASPRRSHGGALPV